MSQVEPTTIPDVFKLSYNEQQPAHVDGSSGVDSGTYQVLRAGNSNGVHNALVHKQDEVQIHAYELKPGGVISSHYHTKNWDIFYIIEGEFTAYHNKSETPSRGGKNAMHLIPPGAVHEIVNLSKTEVLKFLLIQSPSKEFDFIRSDLPD